MTTSTPLSRAIVAYYHLPTDEPWLKHKKECRGINPFMQGWLEAAKGERETVCTYENEDAKRYWTDGYRAHQAASAGVR